MDVDYTYGTCYRFPTVVNPTIGQMVQGTPYLSKARRTSFTSGGHAIRAVQPAACWPGASVQRLMFRPRIGFMKSLFPGQSWAIRLGSVSTSTTAVLRSYCYGSSIN